MISLQSLGKKGPILTKHTFKLLFAVLDLFVLCMSLMQKKETDISGQVYSYITRSFQVHTKPRSQKPRKYLVI